MDPITGIDPDGPFQFINVALWESAEQLAAGLKKTGEEIPEIAQVFPGPVRARTIP